MTVRKIKIGNISREAYKRRTIAIARGDCKPKRGEPKVWFESVQSSAQVLSSENQELLKIINACMPASLKELEFVSGRKRNNLSRTLKTISRYGIVRYDLLVPFIFFYSFLFAFHPYCVLEMH